MKNNKDKDKDKFPIEKVKKIIEEIASELYNSSDPPRVEEFKDILSNLTYERINNLIPQDRNAQIKVKKEVDKIITEIWERVREKFSKKIEGKESSSKVKTKEPQIEYVDYSQFQDITSNPAMYLEYMKSQEFEEDRELRKYIEMQIREMKQDEIVSKKRDIKSRIERVRRRAIALKNEKQRFKDELLNLPPIFEQKINIQKFQKKELFGLLQKQFENFNYIQIFIDNQNFKMQFGGYFYPSKLKFLFEIELTDSELIYKIYSIDKQNSFDFKEKLVRLINFSLDYLEKVQVSTNLIYINIKNAFNSINELFGLFDLCNEGSTEKIYLKVSNIKMLFEGKLKLLKFAQILEKLRLKLAKYLEKEKIDSAIKSELQFIILNWIQEILFFAESNIRNYIETVKEQDVITRIKENLVKIQEKSNAYINDYERDILQHLVIMGKYNGIAYYSHAFKKSEIMANLLSGLLSAIQSFGYEIMRKRTTSIKTMQYEGLNIFLSYGEDILTALITTGRIIGPLYQKLEAITKEFEIEFKEELIEFDGKVDVFQSSENLIKKFFKI
ncbi:MAG: hypothetical protein ACTSO9_00870 [Candidatus Helarchaeota archaeon]